MTLELTQADSKPNTGYLLALVGLWVALFLWGMHAPAGRYLALKGVSMTGLMAARLWIGSLLFWAFLIAKRRVDLSFLRGNLAKVTFLSFIGIYLNMLVFQYGMNYVPATLVLLLENLAPFFVILLLWKVDGKRPSRVEITCQLTAFAGLLVIILGKGGINGDWNHFMLGILLETIAGITWGVYTYLSGRWLKQIFTKATGEKRFYATLNFICILLTISAILAAPNLLQLDYTMLNYHDYLLIAMIGLLQTGIAYMLWNFALSTLPVTTVSVCFYMTVVFTCMNEVLFLHLHLSWIMILGASLILGSALKLSRTHSREKTA